MLQIFRTFAADGWNLHTYSLLQESLQVLRFLFYNAITTTGLLCSRSAS